LRIDSVEPFILGVKSRVNLGEAQVH
jgi:hypothetical protein